MQESIHGNLKRLQYITEIISKVKPQSILDIGCGNGIFLTIPIAEKFASIRITGVDSDLPTIDMAKKVNTLNNLLFCVNEDLNPAEQFDLVIASEVIEHVEQPYSFMRWIATKVKPGGYVIITTPNGYGMFEIMTFIETLLDLTGIMKVLARLPFLKKLKVGNSYTSDDLQEKQHDTLAISPHVNFFSLGKLKKIFIETGFSINAYRARTFLGGLGFNQILKSPSMLQWNANTADSLPAVFVSGWMFVLKFESKPRLNLQDKEYKRSLNENFRKWLTAKRWKII
jgi:2-polyprenyl-3-methyl-5-hydroxy-6-metoxy-1,4-benzoquinol methylase